MDRKALAKLIDGYDDEIKILQDGKRDTFVEYRAKLFTRGMDKVQVAEEVAAFKKALRKRRARQEDATKVDREDDLVDEILAEIDGPVARRAPRVENIEEFRSVRDSDAAPLSPSERSQLAPAGDVSDESPAKIEASSAVSIPPECPPAGSGFEEIPASDSNHAHLPNTAGVKTDESASPSDSSVAISEPDAVVDPSSAKVSTEAEEGTQNQSVRTATAKVGKQSGGKLPVPPIDPHRFGSHVRATPAEMPDMPKWLSEQIDARHKARTTLIEGNKV